MSERKPWHFEHTNKDEPHLGFDTREEAEREIEIQRWSGTLTEWPDGAKTEYVDGEAWASS